jgi:general secretion pathway protein G
MMRTSRPAATSQFDSSIETAGVPDNSSRDLRNAAWSWKQKSILVTLFATALISSAAVFFAPTISSSIRQSRIERANADITLFRAGLSRFEIDTGRYPSGEEGLATLLYPSTGILNWHGPYVPANARLIDPWNRPYSYIFPARHCEDGYELYSLGPDGLEGTADDIFGVSDPNK